MPSTRSSLLFQLRGGENTVQWRQFVEIYRPLIEQSIRRSGVARQDVDDVVQSVLMQLVKVLPTFQYQRQRGFFRNWLRRVTTNQSIDLHRRKSRHPHLLPAPEFLLAEESNASNEDIEFQKEMLQTAIRSVRGEFRPRTWQSFELRVLEQRNAAEISQRLEISENAVYVNASRVLSRIRKFCTFHGEELLHEDILESQT